MRMLYFTGPYFSELFNNFQERENFPGNNHLIGANYRDNRDVWLTDTLPVN